MRRPSDFLDAVGDTPLIRLRRASEATGCEIWGKCEFMNPGASVKDRAAKYLILDGLKRKLMAGSMPLSARWAPAAPWPASPSTSSPGARPS